VEEVLFKVHEERRRVEVDVKKWSCLKRILEEIFVIKGVILLTFCDFLPTRLPGTQLPALVNMYEKQVVNVSNLIS
jgi:hypothetical protein